LSQPDGRERKTTKERIKRGKEEVKGNNSIKTVYPIEAKGKKEVTATNPCREKHRKQRKRNQSWGTEVNGEGKGGG